MSVHYVYGELFTSACHATLQTRFTDEIDDVTCADCKANIAQGLAAPLTRAQLHDILDNRNAEEPNT